MHRFFDDMNDLEEKQKELRGQIVKKQTKILSKVVSLQKKSQKSLDSLKEEEESLESKLSKKSLPNLPSDKKIEKESEKD